MNQNRFSEGPYKLGDKLPMSDVSFTTLETEIKTAIANAAHAEGRKSAEDYTEKMLVCAKDEVRKCHEEIRRLEDKYARNVYKMPPYNPSFDEKEHSELVEKGTKAWAGHVEEKGTTEGASHWTPITNVELEKLTKDFDEILEIANGMRSWCDVKEGWAMIWGMQFDAWKKARGIE
mgnify:CR=1 FL=1